MHLNSQKRSRAGAAVGIVALSCVLGTVGAAASWTSKGYGKPTGFTRGGFVHISVSPCRGWPLRWYYGSSSWYGWKGFYVGPFIVDSVIFGAVTGCVLGAAYLGWLRLRARRD